MMKPQTALKAGIIISMAVVMIFLMSAAAPAMSSQQVNPATSTSSGNIQPEALLNTNATWSTFHNGWKPLEYSNGSANLTLQANLNSEYQNPMTVNPADIQQTQLKGPLGTSDIQWNKTYYNYGGNAGAVTTGKGEISMTTSSSNTSSNVGKLYWNISTAYTPSITPSFDYVTMILQNTQTGTGNAYISVGVGNGTNLAGAGPSIEITNETAPKGNGNLPTTGSIFISFPASDFVKNFDSGYMQIGLWQDVPQTTTARAISVNSTISGLYLSTSPLTLGTFTNKTGTHQITGMETTNNQDIATTFDPSFPWTTITDSGYTVSISQNLQNETTQQNAINDGNYIEQVEYQGSFKLPSTPDLSYGPSSLTEKFNISTSQVAVLDINGVSYVNAISGKNGTVVLLSPVNPTSTTTYLEIIDYSSSQWEKVSGPPGFFSEQGFEYYFDVFILGIMALIGLGGGAAAIHLRNLRRMR